jgi:hypothetical protein
MAKKSKPDYLWTVMVYLAGDNNLTEESVFSITEMQKVPTDGRIAVIAQFDPKASHIPTHRYVIKGASPHKTSSGRAKSSPVTPTIGTDAIALEDPTIKFPNRPGHKASAQRPKPEDGETDSGDPATLFDFISWTQEHYPAERYMVVLAGHGAGTEDDFLLKDENPGSSLSIPALREVFEEVKQRLNIKVDILGMDVCLMSMVEVCYELEGLVDYLVSSESFSPAAGWPYGQILEKIDATLQKNKKAGTEELASSIVREYISFYNDYVVGGLSVDQSVLKVSASVPLVKAVKNFTETIGGWLNEPSFRDAIILAHWESQSYNGELFVDLRDFCELLAVRYPRAAKACGTVIHAIDDLVRKSCFTGVQNQFSNGVSIYFPWSDVAATYQDLAFAHSAGWNDFLQKYVDETRRPPRGSKKGSRSITLKGSAANRSGILPLALLGSERFRKSEDRKSEDRGVNPIHSMRNPPITVVKEGLSECIQASPTFVKRLGMFSKIFARQPRR